MSRATKRKHVVRELLEQFPEPSEQQQIVKVGAPRGNNLHEGHWPSGEVHLLSMPTKFRKNVYIKRGDFVIVEPIDEGDKVKAEIVHILAPPQIRHLKKSDLWPVEFESRRTGLRASGDIGDNGGDNDEAEGAGDRDDDDDDDDDDGSSDDLMFQNPNRVGAAGYNDDEEDDEDEEEEEKDQDVDGATTTSSR